MSCAFNLGEFVEVDRYEFVDRGATRKDKTTDCVRMSVPIDSGELDNGVRSSQRAGQLPRTHSSISSSNPHFPGFPWTIPLPTTLLSASALHVRAPAQVAEHIPRRPLFQTGICRKRSLFRDVRDPGFTNVHTGMTSATC